MRTDSLEKVLERLATTEKATLVFARDTEGQIRVTSGSWDREEVILKGQVLEVRNIEGAAHRARDPPPRRRGPADLAVCPLWAGQSESDLVTGHGAE